MSSTPYAVYYVPSLYTHYYHLHLSYPLHYTLYLSYFADLYSGTSLQRDSEKQPDSQQRPTCLNWITTPYLPLLKNLPAPSSNQRPACPSYHTSDSNRQVSQTHVHYINFEVCIHVHYINF